jgi:ankyrin repeat protein
MAMHKAARDNNADEMQALIVSGKHDINERDSMKRTPLHLASWSGHAEIVKLLLQSKAKTDLLANDNFSALHFASTAEIVKLLVKSNKALLAGRVSKGNKTALHLAIPKGNIEVVQCLIDLGCDITAKTSSGQGCLELAKSDEIYALFKRLLQEKIDKQQEIIDKRLEQSKTNSLEGVTRSDSVAVAITSDAEHVESSDLPSSTDTAVPSRFEFDFCFFSLIYTC